MKHILWAAFAVVTLGSCSVSDDAAEGLSDTPIVLAPAMETYTRAAENYPLSDYFSISGGAADLSVATVSGSAPNYEYSADYVYQAGKLQGATAGTSLYFPLSKLDLTVKWPADAARETLGTAIPTDQSDQAVFFGADWLSATLTGVAKTDAVAVVLKHERAKVTFTMASGGKIDGLSYGGFTAYIDASPAVKDAQLILDPVAHANLFGTAATGGVIVGGNAYEFTISSAPAIQAGGNNTITITLQP